jgi:hypothetical protein
MGMSLPNRALCLLVILIGFAWVAGCSFTSNSDETVEATSIAIIALTEFANNGTGNARETTPPILTNRETPVPTSLPPLVFTQTPQPESGPRVTPTPVVMVEQPTPVQQPTETPLPAPTVTREIVYQDDFQATKGWYTFEGERYQMKYNQGAYQIVNNVLNAAVTSVRTQNHADVHLEVDAARLSGPPNAYYGLVCRYQDDSNYYALVIGSDGFYGIIRMMGGQTQFISPPPSPASALQGGFAVNRIGATCSGHNLTLYVNGAKLFDIKDTTFSSGYIGLMVGTTSVPGIEVRFDNFSVSR